MKTKRHSVKDHIPLKYRKGRNMAKHVKWGKLGAPHSAKRKAWMKKIAKKR